MRIEGAPFAVVDWRSVPPTKHPGTKGVASWRTVDAGNVRVRIVEYPPGYVADHWCPKGHVVYVLEGELITELKDGRKFVMKKGSSYQVAEDEGNPHMSRTRKGAKLFIVD
jgi:quercetin dioxygenase-like cupin family protein